MSAQAIPTGIGLNRLLKNSDVVLAIAVMIIIGMMVVPLPTLVVDIFLALNIGAALTIMLISMYVMEPLQFSVFPSLLLLVTLFRLALNVTTARLILLQADAGQLVSAFGQFVVGGNYVVGLVIFVILIIIQFVVITSGAGRVAEVAARFTLDAMPGKQMSIDADLNAGIITEEQARVRRKEIAREADFYGAMDGASKFIKGDVTAAVLIMLVNVVGGFVTGLLLQGMSVEEAVGKYILLTVGAGLATQIPALLISTATGIIVTRSAEEANMGRAILQQTLGTPRILGIAAGVVFAFALVPGLPKLPFVLIGGGLAVVAWTLIRAAKAPSPPEATTPVKPARETVEDMDRLLKVDPMSLEVGYSLIPLVDENRDGNLLDRITGVRRQIATELGFIMPKVRIRDNLRLPPQTYVIRLRGEEVARGELMTHHLLAMGTGSTDQALQGIEMKEPVFGLPAIWISASEKDHAEMLGYTVVDPLSVLTTHLTEVVKRHAAELVGRQEVRKLLDNLRNDFPALVDDLIPNVLTVGDVQRVLQNLLRERVSILDLPAILEAIGYKGQTVKDPDTLSEYARQALARSLCNQYRESDGMLHVITLSPRLEQFLASSLQATDQGLALNIEPNVAQRILEQVSHHAERVAGSGHQPIIVCGARIRLAFQRLVTRIMPYLVVMAYSEVVDGTHVFSEGMVEVEINEADGAT